MKIATSITIEEELLEEIDILAEKEGRTRSNMIVQILKEKLENLNNENK